MTIPVIANQVVTFVPADWSAEFPEFAAVNPSAAQMYFNIVTAGLVDNTANSPIQDPATLTTALYLATAHVAKLFGAGAVPPAGGSATPGVPGLVGRISSASEGSVSVSSEYATPASASAAYWQQTPYGALYLTIVAPYTTGFYAPPRNPAPTSVGLVLGRNGAWGSGW